MTVYNQLDHEIKHYNLFGPDVLLSATGSGVLTPARVPASEFVNGTAVVEVHYDKSESFTINASPASGFQSEARRVNVNKKLPAVSPAGTALGQKVVAVRSGPQGETPKKGESNEVSDISLDEPLDRSIITIHFVPGDKLLKYSVATEVSGGSKWIVLKLKPAATRLVSPLRFESSFFRQILIEEDQRERGALWVKIEEIKSSRFRVKKQKDFITVTLRH
ncbi:MAG: hypothetical protein HZA19_04300 [Nitrospirae bacterium]|nr:hypothetical protein [Nitrospirota bacterium]